MMVPPLMGVRAVTPAKSSAFWFTSAAWPSTRVSSTGTLGNSWSSVSLVGNCWPGQSFWSQPRPVSQAACGYFCRFSRSF